ncbi:MAG: hypothetical protein WBO35_05785 [Candidatus Saccharimonadales bacterium]
MKFINTKQTGRVINALLAGLFTCSYALSAAAPFVLTSVAHADAPAPAGNNGTVKINEVDVDNGQGNNPQLETCTLNVKWFGFDAGTRQSTVSFEAQNPTSASQLLTPAATQSETFTGTGAGGTQLAYSKDYNMSFSGAPQGQGYHVKVTIATDGSQGSDTKSKVYWMPGKCQASVAAATVATVDLCGVANDTYTIPTTPHVTYSVGGAALTAGVHSTGGAKSIVVTATADAGYVLGGPATQTLAFTDVACKVTPAPCMVSNLTYSSTWDYDDYTNPDAGAWPEDGVEGTYKFMVDGLYLTTPETESYVSGLVSAGNTKLSDIDTMTYKTLRLASSTGDDQVAPSYILYVDLDGDTTTTADQTYLFYEPIYNGTVQTGTWQTWDVMGGGASKWWSFDLTDGKATLTWDGVKTAYPNAVALSYGFNQGTYNQGANTAVQDLVFDCATLHFTGAPGGQGGGEVRGETTTTPTPVVKKTVAPTLENTGSRWLLPTLASTALVLLSASIFVPTKKLARTLREVQFVAPMSVW